MAVRIQLRRDTAANWVSTNPVLREGELGIETDTLQIKIGNGNAWNSITNYANVVPSDLNTTLGDYVLVSDIGSAGGVVGLDNDKNAIITGSSIIIEGPTADSYETTLTVTDPTADRTITLPNASGTMALTSDITTAVDAITTDVIEEGSTNKYFTNERAQDAVSTALSAGTHTNITVTYDDNANSISLAAAPGYVDEQAVDAVAAALAAGTHTNITVTYSDETNAISLTGATTYSDENAQDAIGNSLGTGLSYNDTTGAISVDTSAIQARVTDVSDTEIGYLNGVTSGIQSQIDSKLATSTASSTYAPIANPTFTGTVTLPGAPSTANEAATKAYVDNITAGLNFHAAVHVATTTDLSATYNNGAGTLSASGTFPTIDGETITETQRVLVKSQTDAKENGIYELTDDGDPSGTWVLTRAADANNTPSGEVAYGDFVFVQTGTANGGYGFTMTTTGTITLGTSNINWTQFNAGQAVIAGNGLTETSPGTIAIDTTITADLSTAQTLTNKTLTSPIISTISNTGTITLPTTTGTLALTSQVPATSTTAITANTATTIDTIALTDFITAEYQVTIHQGTSTRSSKVLVQTDGTSVDYNEYAIMATGTAIPGVAVAASVSSTNMILQATITNGETANGRAFIIKNVTSGVAPATPTSVSASVGDQFAYVNYTAQDNGGSATTYTATSSPGGFTGTGSSPITVSGLTNGTSYTFTVVATNKYGSSAASSETNSVTPAPISSISGGTLSSDSTYYYRTFTSTSSFTVGINPLAADILIIAGGGCGAKTGGDVNSSSGGGGAGGVLYASSQTLSPSTYTATVGAGGSIVSYYPTNGSNSVLSGGSITTQTAIGGGTGGYMRGGVGMLAGTSGGSGGGGGFYQSTGSRSNGGAGTPGQGFAGGNSISPYQGAGGGGAGAAAANSNVNNNGGSGTNTYSSWLSAISPQMTGVSGWSTATSSGYIAGGGAGGNGSGGVGGGGKGGRSGTGWTTADRSGGPGVTNTGSGGGAVNDYGGGETVGTGGSGIIIVRYLKAAVGG